MDNAQIKDLETRLKKLENIFYGISDDPRVKEVVRKNIIVEVTDDGNPIVIDKNGNKYTLDLYSPTSNILSVGEPTELTIASGSITPTGSHHFVDTEGGGASDDLNTITTTGLPNGMILVLRPESGLRAVVLKDDVGNLRLAGDFSMDGSRDTITLMLDGASWYEVSRSDNS